MACWDLPVPRSQHCFTGRWVSVTSLCRTIKNNKMYPDSWHSLLERDEGIEAALDSNPLLISFPMIPTNRKRSLFQSRRYITLEVRQRMDNFWPWKHHRVVLFPGKFLWVVSMVEYFNPSTSWTFSSSGVALAWLSWGFVGLNFEWQGKYMFKDGRGIPLRLDACLWP